MYHGEAKKNGFGYFINLEDFRGLKFHHLSPSDEQVHNWWTGHRLQGDTSEGVSNPKAVNLLEERQKLIILHNNAHAMLAALRGINQDTLSAGNDPSLPEFPCSDESELKLQVLETNEDLPSLLQSEHPEAQ